MSLSQHIPRKRPLVGISACLKGEAVRYDGGDKLQSQLVQRLSPFLDLQPYCPEVTAGLGVPREPVNLVEQDNGEVRAVGVKQKRLDVTPQLASANDKFVSKQSVDSRLCGYILKSRSPSCGLNSTPIYSARTESEARLGSGLFAGRLRSRLPHLVLVEETYFADDPDHWRFISACCWVWREQYGAELDAGLAALLARYRSATELLDRNATNEKAALWRRLLEYWQTCVLH